MEALKTDAATALLRALRGAFGAFGGTLVVEELRSRRWASITFTGARHELRFRLEGPDAGAEATRFLATMEAAEFALRGHVLADIALVFETREEGCAVIAIEALTVEDD
jgi:hypothetical protein